MQELDETVEAIVLLSGGKPRPYRIRWRNTVYYVTNVLDYYSMKALRLHVFSLQTKEDDCIEIAVSADDLSCRIRRIS